MIFECSSVQVVCIDASSSRMRCFREHRPTSGSVDARLCMSWAAVIGAALRCGMSTSTRLPATHPRFTTTTQWSPACIQEKGLIVEKSHAYESRFRGVEALSRQIVNLPQQREHRCTCTAAQRGYGYSSGTNMPCAQSVSADGMREAV